MDARYNLRSTKREHHIPVQLQLLDDADFMAETLRTTRPGQVSDLEHSDDSTSDINISALLDHSDQNLSSCPTHSDKGAGAGGSGSASRAGGARGTGNIVSQNEINQIILAQLNSLGDRLDNMEKNKVKKTSDMSKVKSSASKTKRTKAPVTTQGFDTDDPLASASVHNLPPPTRLREEARIQAEVQNRLRQLADNARPGTEKFKSQRGGSVDVFVNKRVKWPHEFVLAGQNKDRISYNQLSPIQWMAGFCRTIREESCAHTKENMLEYVINLLEDAQDFSWSSAKACHAALLCRMEQGEISSWNDTEKIDRLRRAHAQRHVATSNGISRNSDKANSTKTTPCIYYNKSSCGQKQSHETKGVYYNHICASCWYKDSKAFAHTQVDCRKHQSKNE